MLICSCACPKSWWREHWGEVSGLPRFLAQFFTVTWTAVPLCGVQGNVKVSSDSCKVPVRFSYHLSQRADGTIVAEGSCQAGSGLNHASAMTSLGGLQQAAVPQPQSPLSAVWG